MDTSSLTPVIGRIAIAIVLVMIAITIVGEAYRRYRENNTPFKKRSLLNKSEHKVFADLTKVLPNGHHLMCQVSYGAVLQNPSRKRYMSINSKRADFMIFDEQTQIVAVIEYQGSGHFGRSQESKARAIESDRIKRSALSDAGIPLLEVPARYSASLIHGFVTELTTNAEKVNPID